MVGHLEHVQAGEQPRGDELRVNVVLRVAREQERAPVRAPQEDDGGVVDLTARGAWLGGHRAPPGPEHAQVQLADAKPVARSECGLRDGRPGPERRVPRIPARPGAVHARLEDPAHLVPLQDADEAIDVVLVGMCEHQDIDPAVPGRDARIEGEEQPVRVRPAVHQDSPACGRLQQDRVTLADVQHA